MNGQARPKGAGPLAGSNRQRDAVEMQAVLVTAERPQQGDGSESMQLRTGPRMRRHAGWAVLGGQLWRWAGCSIILLGEKRNQG